MRDLITSRIETILLASDFYGHFLSVYDAHCGRRPIHKGIIENLKILRENLLLEIYERLLSGQRIVPYNVSFTGNTCYVLVGNFWGVMTEDGTVHT